MADHESPSEDDGTQGNPAQESGPENVQASGTQVTGGEVPTNVRAYCSTQSRTNHDSGHHAGQYLRIRGSVRNGS